MSHSVRNKIIASFFVTLVVVMVAAIVIAFQYVHWREHQMSDKMGLTAAETCASMLEFADEDYILADPNSSEYAECRSTMRELCTHNNMDYMYAYRCDVEKGEITYLFCVADDDGNDARVARERAFGTVVKCEFSQQELAALDGNEGAEALELDNQFGHMLAWFCRVEGWKDPVLVGADYSVSEQRARVFGATGRIAGIVFAAFIALLFIQLYVLQRHVFRPISAITERMRAFSADKAGDFEPIAVDPRDEIGAIASAFTEMAHDIDVYVKDIERMTSERVQSQVEMDVARRIQLGMVPETTALEAPGLQACALARTAREVGGDFYDSMLIDGGRLAFAIGDVSGKGVAASLFTSMVMAMIHDNLASGESPAASLNRANDRMCQSNPEGMFVTAFAAVFDPATGTLRFANAGHMPPLLAGEDVRVLETDPGTLLGLFEDIGIVDDEVRLAKGESLLVYTDGVTEAVNPQGAFFGEDRFVAALREGAPYDAAQALIDKTVDAVDAFAEGREQFDDQTLVVLMRTPGLTELTADMASFSFIRESIMSTDCDEGPKLKACLACEELFVNVVSYSKAEHVWFDVNADNGALQIILADDGIAFDPINAVIAEKDFEDLDTGGMGIGLVRQLASALDYRREGGRNILRIHFAPNNHA